MSMVFGGYIVDADGYRHQLEAIMDPEELDVRGVLTSIGKGSGVIKMRCEPESEGRPYELALYFESENFLLMLSEYDKDGEHVVRTMTNLNSKNELVSIWGRCILLERSHMMWKLFVLFLSSLLVQEMCLWISWRKFH